MPTSDGKVTIIIDENARQAAKDFALFDKTIRDSEKALKLLEAQGKKDTQAFKDLQATITKNKAELATVNSSFNNVKSSSNGLIASLGSLKGGIIAAGVAFAGMKLAQFAGDIFKISSQFEQLNVAFGVLAGQSAGQQLVKDLTDLANVTPMTTQGLADNARLLLSFGEASQNIIPDLKLLGDISGGNQQKMDALSLAFAQAGSAGRLMGQDLLQMVNAGFNPLQVISEKTGKSMFELRKEMEQGKISFSMIKQAMVDATSEGGRFYGMMEKQSQTLEGRLSTLADKWGLVGKAIGDMFLPYAKRAVDEIIKIADNLLNGSQKSEEFKNALTQLSLQTNITGQNIKSLGDVLSGFRDLIGALIPGTNTFNDLLSVMNTNMAQLGLILGYVLAPLKIFKKEFTFSDVGNEIEKLNAQWRGLDNSLMQTLSRKKNALDFSKQLNSSKTATDNLKNAMSKMNAGFRDSSTESEKHAKKTKQQATEYDKLMQKVNQLQDKLRIMSIRGQENTQAFTQGKEQLAKYTAQIQKANNAIEVQTNPYDKLNYDLQQATKNMQILATGNVIDVNKFKQAKDEVTKLTLQLENANKAMRIDTSPYDALNSKVTELKNNLQDMAVSGQSRTPQFKEMKNSYVEATNKIKEANRQVSNAIGLDWENIGNSIKTDLASALTTPLSEGETAFQRLGNTALNIVSMIGQAMLEKLVISPFVDALSGSGIGKSISGFFGGLFGSADGNVFQGGQHLTAYANGGVVSSPTLFPMKNGTGLMGEAGAEAIMPLKRTSNGRLGVEATGQTSPQINIYNQSQSQIETVTRPNGETDLFVRRVNNALASERTQSGFTRASSRQNSRGITAA